RAPFRPTSGIDRSSPRCATPRWLLIGSRGSGGTDTPQWRTTNPPPLGPPNQLANHIAIFCWAAILGVLAWTINSRPMTTDGPSRKRVRRRDPKQAAADIARLCDHYDRPLNEEGILAAFWQAVRDGRLLIPRDLRPRGRGQPAYDYGKGLGDWL